MQYSNQPPALCEALKALADSLMLSSIPGKEDYD